MPRTSGRSEEIMMTPAPRATRRVGLVAEPRAVSLALAETRKEERRTHLAERLRSAAPERSGPARELKPALAAGPRLD